jgi:response regulator RpfG family c-di-GMP phosphodiesterase
MDILVYALLGFWFNALVRVVLFTNSYILVEIMKKNLIAIVSEASGEDLIHLQQCLPTWQCQIAPPVNEDATLSWFPPLSELIIVYAQKEQRETLAICERFRNSPQSSAIPILLVIGRYDLPQANAVICKGNATFIIAPFEAEELQDKIVKMKEEFGNVGP